MTRRIAAKLAAVRSRPVTPGKSPATPQRAPVRYRWPSRRDDPPEKLRLTRDDVFRSAGSTW